MLGWETWREVEGAHCIGPMEGVLVKLADEGKLDAPFESLGDARVFLENEGR